MNKLTRVLFLLMLILNLQACETTSMINAGPVQAGQLSINTTGNWAQRNIQDILIWTRDGYALNKIIVTTIKKDEHILKGLISVSNDKLKAFNVKVGQNLDTLIELYGDALSAAGLHNVAIVEPEYFIIDDYDAAKFSLEYDTSFGLRYQSRVLLMLGKSGVQTIHCNAPKEHYFPFLKTEFDAIIDSAKIAL